MWPYHDQFLLLLHFLNRRRRRRARRLCKIRADGDEAAVQSFGAARVRHSCINYRRGPDARRACTFVDVAADPQRRRLVVTSIVVGVPQRFRAGVVALVGLVERAPWRRMGQQYVRVA